MRAVSPKVRNSLRFGTDVSVVPWRFLSKFVLLEKGIFVYVPLFR